MQSPVTVLLRRYSVTIRLKEDTRARRITVAAQNESQAKKLIRARYRVTRIECVKRYGWVLAPFAA